METSHLAGSASQHTSHNNLNGIATSSIVVGIVLAVSGVFVILAAAQILPNGVNTISSWKVWGYVAGTGLIGFGTIVALFGLSLATKHRINRQQQIIYQHQLDSNTVRQDTRTSGVSQPTHHSEFERDLLNFLFSELINKENWQRVQPLGKLLPDINEYLLKCNKKYSLNLHAIGSYHSSKSNDPWQTLKIIDKSVKTKDRVSDPLDHINNILYREYGIRSNGGNTGDVQQDQQKKTPRSFVQADGTYMFPQLQISLIDIRRILKITSQESYIQELRNAYKS